MAEEEATVEVVETPSTDEKTSAVAETTETTETKDQYEGLDAAYDHDDELADTEIDELADVEPEVEVKTEAVESPPEEPQGEKGETETAKVETETEAPPLKPQGSEDPTEVVEQQAKVEKEPEVQKATPDEPSSIPPEPEDLATKLEENSSSIIEALASDRFALSKEEEEALETDAVAEIPKLLSKVYLEAVKATLNHVNRMVPGMIDQRINQRAVDQKAETSFYGQFPAIDAAKLGTEVETFATAFRAANPQISQEDLFAMVGAAVMTRNGLVATAPGNGVDGNPPAVPKPSKQPFVPARQGASVQVEPETENPFSGLGQVFDE